jgi:hypothetical protein
MSALSALTNNFLQLNFLSVNDAQVDCHQKVFVIVWSSVYSNILWVGKFYAADKETSLNKKKVRKYVNLFYETQFST